MLPGVSSASGADRNRGADPRNPYRARRVALTCEVVCEDHIAWPKTAGGAIADSDFHLPFENENVLSPGRGVPIARIVRSETAEHEVGARLKRYVVDLLGGLRQIFKMGLTVLARINPYDHARAPASREIIMHAKADIVVADRPSVSDANGLYSPPCAISTASPRARPPSASWRALCGTSPGICR